MATAEFPTTTTGYRQLLAWARGFGVLRRAGVEGTGSSGAQTDKLTADVVHGVDTGHVVVANIAGTVTDTDGVTDSYEGGHYLTVVGYRDGGKTVEIADPTSPDKATYWVATGDLANWVATRGYSA